MTVSASDVARGVTRLLAQAGYAAMAEVPLPNGRRADLLALDAKGQVLIVEIKVSRADLHGDTKWPDYWDWCDRFYWALAAGLDPALLETPAYRPDAAGLIVADRYGAAIVREAAPEPLATARRKSESLRLARLAMRRLMVQSDPDLIADWADG
jgi:hypothetical protein